MVTPKKVFKTNLFERIKDHAKICEEHQTLNISIPVLKAVLEGNALEASAMIQAFADDMIKEFEKSSIPIKSSTFGECAMLPIPVLISWLGRFKAGFVAPKEFIT